MIRRKFLAMIGSLFGGVVLAAPVPESRKIKDSPLGEWILVGQQIWESGAGSRCYVMCTNGGEHCTKYIGRLRISSTNYTVISDLESTNFEDAKIERSKKMHLWVGDKI